MSPCLNEHDSTRIFIESGHAHFVRHASAFDEGNNKAGIVHGGSGGLWTRRPGA
jgi:hypothetical protein